MKYKKTTLPNGLRVITVPVEGSPTTTVFVMAEVGSDYESKRENGISHFLEHMLHKGTDKRPSFLVIGKELEGIGAESNAATSGEFTYYYAKGRNKYFKTILDVVSDMYLNASLPETTLEKERGVILQEISMQEDSPRRKVWDTLMSLLYGDTPAGRTTLGLKGNIVRFKRNDFIKYKSSHYIASKTVVIVAGNIDNKKAVAEVRKIFKNIPVRKNVVKPKVKESQKSPAVKVHKKDTDQTHLLLAFRAFPARDKRMNALKLLSFIMGRGFTSRLFQKMREEMGACYYVGASVDDSIDHGSIIISAGIDKRRIEEVISALIEECAKFTNELVGEEELNKAKEYLLGKMYMRLETADEVADFYAMQEVSVGKLKTPQELEKEIRAVTAKDIQKVAKDVFQNKNLNLAVVGNVDEKKLKKVLKI